MKIAILGTRGIPNLYGGFEACAERMSVHFAAGGHEVTVYNPDGHPYRGAEWQGVKIRRVFSGEKKLGFAGNFIFDYLSLRDAVRRKCDIVLELGASPASLYYRRFAKKGSKIVTNMDGLEWKRDKWNTMTRRLLKYTEKRAARYSDALVADNEGIRDYLKEEYGVESAFIPYGSDIPAEPGRGSLRECGLEPGNYFLLIARMEPENNVGMILDGYRRSGSAIPMVIVGSTGTAYGKVLRKTYGRDGGIKFLGPVYEREYLNALRHFCRLYFHGHSVGGTNPSLLEAMACGAPVAAHDNIFNRNVLGGDSFYFASAQDVSGIVRSGSTAPREGFAERNLGKIRSLYNWESVSEKYLGLFREVLKDG